MRQTTARARQSQVQASSARDADGGSAIAHTSLSRPGLHEAIMPCWKPPPVALCFPPRMLDSGVGFDRLMTSLSAIGADSLLPLPGVDTPTSAADYLCRALTLLRDRDVPFEQAWSSAINRIQAPQGEGGFVEDPSIGALVAEERALLEENRPRWQAAYERRPMTTREAAVCTVGAWRRWDGGAAGIGSKRAA